MTTPALQRFFQIARERHQYAKDWQARTGGKVAGYFCTYVPEEILHAAGLLPVRVFGSGDSPEESDRYVAPTWCAFSRDCLAEGLRGKYDYLGGVVYAYSCYHMMQAYDAWVRHVPTSFNHFLDLPWDVAAPAARAYSRRETQRFLAAVEAYAAHKVDDASLEQSIAVFDENRRLLRKLYDLRKAPRPPVTGAEVLQIMMAAECMDKAEHSALLRQLFEELQGRQVAVSELRFLVSGSEFDRVEVIELIESLGALVVIDDLCVGSRYFWNEAPAGADPVQRIADRYLDRPPCPFKDVRLPRRRLDHLVRLAKEYKVDGVVFFVQKFCEPHSWDTTYNQKALNEQGIPNIALEITIPNAAGPLRTRLEAFIEMLALESV